MRITLKLFAYLSDYLPARVEHHVRVGNQITVDVPEGAAVQAVIDRFNLPRGLTHLVLVNGHYIPPAERVGHLLHDGDVVAIWPPVAGG